MNPFIVNLRNCRIGVVAEFGAHLLQVDMIKRLAGCETITVRSLYSNPVTFRFKTRLFFVANNLPKFASTVDYALERRIKYIYFAKNLSIKANVKNEIDLSKATIYNAIGLGLLQLILKDPLDKDPKMPVTFQRYASYAFGELRAFAKFLEIVIKEDTEGYITFFQVYCLFNELDGTHTPKEFSGKQEYSAKYNEFKAFVKAKFNVEECLTLEYLDLDLTNLHTFLNDIIYNVVSKSGLPVTDFILKSNKIFNYNEKLTFQEIAEYGIPIIDYYLYMKFRRDDIKIIIDPNLPSYKESDISRMINIEIERFSKSDQQRLHSGIAGSRLFNIFRSNIPKNLNTCSEDLINIYNVINEVADNGPFYEMHPFFMPIELANISLCKNLYNLIVKLYSKEKIEYFKKCKQLYEIKGYDARYSQYLKWDKDIFNKFKSKIIRQ
ncbi:hypothetical protein CWI39_1484p0010 [Hamiltosporidium magnivora]|uniref:Uncharacterized protein n=1 Tax=Hamiltosporidium magnivora TaxID=148818 RepID=A0A4Q9L2L8_9MICR|nr:hypothetical protein CWI39_1484p0010 [Hamiltosporidium magnivora]